MMVSIAEQRRFIANIKTIGTMKLQEILKDLVVLYSQKQLTSADERFMFKIEEELQLRGVK